MPEDPTALLILAYGIVPGFVFFRTLNAVVAIRNHESSREVISSVAASMIFWVLVAGPLVWALDRWPSGSARSLVLLVASLLTIAVPAAAGFSFGKVLEKRARLGRFLGMRPFTPSSWDYRFGRGEALVVRVVLEDGSQLLGFWGAESFAGGHPTADDRYLEGVYTLDGEGLPVAPQPQTAGAWIPRSSIKYLPFTYPHEAPPSTDEQRGSDDHEGQA